MRKRPLLRLSSLLLVVAACHPQSVGTPEVPQDVRDRSAGPTSEPAPDTPVPARPDTVTIELSPHGLAASITADEGVSVVAHDDGVLLETGEGFEMVIGKGGLDMEAELAELVREYGSRFERFLTEDDHVVAWEISNPTGSDYRFFASFPDGPMPYHCRTGDQAASSPQLLNEMVEICRTVQAAPADAKR